MDRVTSLELKNAFEALLFFGAFCVFAINLWHDRKNSQRAYYATLIALGTFFIFLSTQQFWYWAWGHFSDRAPNWITHNRVWMLFAMDVGIAASAAYLIRQFSAHRYGRKAWFGVLLCSVVGALLLVFALPA